MQVRKEGRRWKIRRKEDTSERKEFEEKNS